MNFPTKLFSNASTVQTAKAFKKEDTWSNERVIGYDLAYHVTLPSISSRNSSSQQETTTFDVMANETLLTRRKEGAIDYRFMPEPVVLT